MLNAIFGYQFVRYLIASSIALCLDYGSYWVIAETKKMALPTAAAIGYCIGLIVSYFLISGPVFKDGWLRKHKFFELALFLLSGLLGVTLTFSTVYLYVTSFGERLHCSKLIGIIVSFTGVFLFRKYVVFRKSNANTT